MREPLVTVLMPVYNGERYLRPAIESILSQTFADFEFLIVNDGSTDGSAEIVRSYHDRRIRLVHNEVNERIVASLNKGLVLARGKIIARMDCDDFSCPDRLGEQLAYLDRHADIAIVGTWIQRFGKISPWVDRYPISPDRVKCELLFQSALAHSTVMMRRDVLLKYDLRYDPARLIAEDWDLWCRASFLVGLANVPQVLLKYRVHEQGSGTMHEAQKAVADRAIDVDNLKRLGVVAATAAELEVHRDLGFYRLTRGDRTFLERADAWLRRLCALNQAFHTYPEPTFTRIAGWRWWCVCASTPAPRLWKLRRFLQSPLCRAACLEWLRGKWLGRH
jgi:glycosyltransferase involved in cell wall biosynthesis